MEFSRTVESKSPLYVLWKVLPEKLPNETGYRRCRVFLEDNQAIVQYAEQKKIIRKGSIDEILNDERAYKFSLNAGSRGALLYAISIPGVYVTGGGSTYNEKLLNYWKNKSFPRPSLTYISTDGFSEMSKRLAIDLPSKVENIKEVLENAQNIKNSSDPLFLYFAAWRAP